MVLMTEAGRHVRGDRNVGWFTINTAFVEEFLALPAGVRIVDVRPNGDCSSLDIRVCGEGVPHTPEGSMMPRMNPQVECKVGVADDGTKVRQLFFKGWFQPEHEIFNNGK